MFQKWDESGAEEGKVLLATETFEAKAVPFYRQGSESES